MRTPARTKGTRAQVSRTVSLPAPVGGWNTRDPLAAMDVKDAVTLVNWFPMPAEVMIRKGSTDHVTGFSGPVESLMAYQSATSSKLFAVVDVGATAEIVDVTASDTDGTPPASAVTSLTNARFQHINISTSGGSFLLAVNGADKMQYYTGSGWDVDGGGTYTVTGVNTADCIHIAMHMRRVWLIQKSSLLAWYLPADSIAGAANSFDFRPIFSRGGYLMAMGTWTLDAGQGVDDHAVFVTSEGEIAVYKGTDPSSASTWALVGVWYVGKPMGRRCLEKFGGDLLLICQDGLLPFSKALMSSRVNTKTALTDKIQSAVSEATSFYADSFGWQMVPYPQENMLILNVPASSQEQYVMNTITGAWSKFTGWEANCWAEFNGSVYYGSDDSVVKAWTGTSDNGANIETEAQQAFHGFGSRTLKNWRMARPIFRADVLPGVVMGLDVDYASNTPIGTPSFTGVSTALWDTAEWDESSWAGGAFLFKDWQTVFGNGYTASAHLLTASNSSVCAWASTDFLLEDGAVL